MMGLSHSEMEIDYERGKNVEFGFVWTQENSGLAMGRLQKGKDGEELEKTGKLKAQKTASIQNHAFNWYSWWVIVLLKDTISDFNYMQIDMMFYGIHFKQRGKKII